MPWQDASGANVDIFIGAFSTTPVGTSVAGWVSGEAPASVVFEFDATTAQAWADQGFIDLVLQVADDGSGTSRFNLSNNTPSLEFQMDTFILGDVNMDGVVGFLDIQPFIDALSQGFIAEADIDGRWHG